VPNVVALRRGCVFFEGFSAPIVCVLLEWFCWGAILSLFLLDVHWRLPRTADNSTFIERITLPLLRPPPPMRADASFLDVGWDVRLLSTKVLMWVIFEGLFTSVWALFSKQDHLLVWHDACMRVRRVLRCARIDHEMHCRRP
jgi:hypothetical protein